LAVVSPSVSCDRQVVDEVEPHHRRKGAVCAYRIAVRFETVRKIAAL
jgi:hypothetical protein